MRAPIRCCIILVGGFCLLTTSVEAQFQVQDHSIGFSKKPEEPRTYCYNRYQGRFLHWGQCTAPEPTAPTTVPTRSATSVRKVKPTARPIRPSLAHLGRRPVRRAIPKR